MNIPSYPPVLTQTAWERQAGAVAKAKPVTLGAELKALEKSFDALDFSALETEKLADVEEAADCVAGLGGEFDKCVRALIDQSRAVEAAAAKVDSQFRKDPTARPAVQAAAAIARAAAAQRVELAKSFEAAKAAAAKRLEELKEAAAKAAKPAPAAPERNRLKERVKAQFGIVKNRPDRKVEFLLCIGHQAAVAYLGPTASNSHRPTLTKALKGDTGFKFYRGECIWEDGGYTFVGPKMSSTLARRIERGITALTGTRYRVRAREED